MIDARNSGGILYKIRITYYAQFNVQVCMYVCGELGLQSYLLFLRCIDVSVSGRSERLTLLLLLINSLLRTGYWAALLMGSLTCLLLEIARDGRCG